jgi:hypothetical protein
MVKLDADKPLIRFVGLHLVSHFSPNGYLSHCNVYSLYVNFLSL